MDRRLQLLFTVIGFLAIYGAVTAHFPLFFSSLLALVIVALAYIANYYVFHGLSIERKVSRPKVGLGEDVYYKIEVVNRKLLPVFWLEMTEQISDGIEFANPQVLRKAYLSSGTNTFVDLFNLRWYEKLRRSYLIKPQRRGRYWFDKAVVNCWDLLGFFGNSCRTLLTPVELIVYPKVLPLAAFGVEHSRLFGDRSKDGWIYTDPLNKVGTRPYNTTDSIRQINWKASARHLQLQTEVLKPAFDQEVHLFLDRTFAWRQWGSSEASNSFELQVVYAASLVEHYCRHGYRVSFYSNVLLNSDTARGYTVVKPGNIQDQREHLLTTLALLHSASVGPLCSLLLREGKNIGPGARVVVLTHNYDDQLIAALRQVGRGANLTVVYVGSERPARSRGDFPLVFLDERRPWYDYEEI